MTTPEPISTYDGRPGPEVASAFEFPCTLMIRLDTGERLRITGVTECEAVQDLDVTLPAHKRERVALLTTETLRTIADCQPTGSASPEPAASGTTPAAALGRVEA